MPVVMFIYLLLCAVIAWFGRNRTIGAVGFFVVAFLVTPMLAALILLATVPEPEYRRLEE
ncbi:MAG: hypothetical protein ACKN9W_04775 [Methylococcus sp.]